MPNIRLEMVKGNKKIIMDVSEDGEVKIETLGYSGKSCIAESKFLKQALGVEVATQLTPAYFVTSTDKVVKKKMLPLCG
jgi:hypothetical protein